MSLEAADINKHDNITNMFNSSELNIFANSWNIYFPAKTTLELAHSTSQMFDIF